MGLPSSKFVYDCCHADEQNFQLALRGQADSSRFGQLTAGYTFILGKNESSSSSKSLACIFKSTWYYYMSLS